MLSSWIVCSRNTRTQQSSHFLSEVLDREPHSEGFPIRELVLVAKLGDSLVEQGQKVIRLLRSRFLDSHRFQ